MSRARDLADLGNNAGGLETLTVSDITDLSVSASNINSTTNQITDSSTDLNVESNTLVVDKSEYKVGIGTSSPSNARTIIVTDGTNGANEVALSLNHGDGSLSANQEVQLNFGQGSDGNVALSQIAGGFEGTSFNGNLIFKVNSGSSGNLTERMRIDSSGNLKFNSGFGSVGTAYACRAWVNFKGTGTVAIRASGNVSSITDNGVGDYTINFTNAMPDSNYTVASCGTDLTNYITSIRDNTTAPTTSSVRVATRNSSFSLNDAEYGLFAIFR